MSQELNYGKTPVVPFKAKEGDITIVKTQTAAGTITGPSVASPLTKGVPVELDDEMTVKDRMFVCGCGVSMDRDLHATYNMLWFYNPFFHIL